MNNIERLRRPKKSQPVAAPLRRGRVGAAFGLCRKKSIPCRLCGDVELDCVHGESAHRRQPVTCLDPSLTMPALGALALKLALEYRCSAGKYTPVREVQLRFQHAEMIRGREWIIGGDRDTPIEFTEYSSD